MIIDITPKYLNYLKTKPSSFISSTICSSLRNKLIQVQSHLSNFKNTVEKQSLPTFTKKRNDNVIKCNLNLQLVQLENQISEIKNMNFCENMKKNMYTYFGDFLKIILIEYRNIEEKNLKKYSYNDNYYVDNSLQNNEMNDFLQIKKVNDAEQIRKSIFFLTTMLMEIKMVVNAQREKIDRVEMVLEKVEKDLECANEELECVANKQGKGKNRFIFGLSLCVIFLIVLSMIKAARKKGLI